MGSSAKNYTEEVKWGDSSRGKINPIETTNRKKKAEKIQKKCSGGRPEL